MNCNYDLNRVYSKIRFKDSIKEAFFKDNPTRKFRAIEDERKTEIEKMATLWSLNHSSLSLEDKFYEIIKEIKKDQSRGFQRKYNLLKGDEKFIFFLSAFDPALVMLRISLDSSDKSEYFTRIKEEFGFFPDQRVLTLEKFYNKRKDFQLLKMNSNKNCRIHFLFYKHSIAERKETIFIFYSLFIRF